MGGRFSPGVGALYVYSEHLIFSLHCSTNLRCLSNPRPRSRHKCASISPWLSVEHSARVRCSTKTSDATLIAYRMETMASS